ncbi:hypothetical protein M404DRAFT_19888 [Pisolithus tinctorius Marx 270]|uniref:Uncharacterized protein n=1 Tax=Pisolithus tinctorius Marx 270 TaxID=870435 RepID=A0A0C3PE36_PISTI|nr:hypothetical protein M404DRAFT_19888 [Pisolithus tinctorius Marx 270]
MFYYTSFLQQEPPFWEEQAQLEAERAERERAEAERAVWEAEERRACEEEERCEAECKCKAEAKKSDGAGAGSSEAAEVKKVVMDPGTCYTWAKTICEFLIDSNKKWVTCMWCNQSKGKCQWPGDGKDTKVGPKAASKVDKGKKRKVDEETPEARPSKKKWVKLKSVKVLDIDKPEAGMSGVRKAVTRGFTGLKDKLKCLIDMAGLIANSLASLFKLHETTVENSGQIANMLEALLRKSYALVWQSPPWTQACLSLTLMSCMRRPIG